MHLPIHALVEQTMRQLPKEYEAKVRKFIALYRSFAIMKNISKNNLQKMMIYRQHFLAEIELRFTCGDMQFLSNNFYGYIRHYIKYISAEYMKHYIRLKKTNVRLM